MIRDVLFNSTNISAGDPLTMMVNATYPVTIEIYCFVTQPPPTKFVPCPSSGAHRLEHQRTFIFQTSPDTFQSDGKLNINVTDAENDFRSFDIQVSSLDRPLPAY